MSQLIVRSAPRVDRPAKNELERAEALLDALQRAIHIGQKFERRVSLDLDEAEEIAQLLADSTRTAKQLKGGF